VEKKSGPLFIKSEPRKQEVPKFQPERFTPLNASFTEVFMAIKGDLAFRWSAKMKSDPYKRDRNKFYEYHGEHGHSIEDCMVMR
jgi:hypothetical protein